MSNVLEPFVIVIPARFDSVRLPGKVLADINGSPMIEHVWRAAAASTASRVVVATDDERIRAAVAAFGGDAVMTSPNHASGSDRIAECAAALGWSDRQLIVNLQGDEPEMPSECLDQVATLLAADEGAAAATLYRPVESVAEAADPNCVKVVFTPAGDALYFSRSPIPHPQGQADLATALTAGQKWYRHLGLYCYRLGSLRSFAALQPTPLEQRERLEQLRFLENGMRIRIAAACRPIPPGIDTPEDLENARARLVKQP